MSIVLWDCIEALNLTIGDAAVHPQVEEDALTAICERQAPITADMAIRLEMAFGSTADAHNLTRLANIEPADA